MATTITANGINFPDGSAGSPSIGGTDTNTGLFTGSDIVGFATGGSERLRIDASGNINIANDSGKLQLGTSADLQIYHNGTNTYLDNNTGHLAIRTNVGSDVGSNIYLQPHDNEDGIVIVHDGGVELYYDNSKKLETVSYGTVTTGESRADNFQVLDYNGSSTGLMKFGAGDDLKIYHDGTDSYIQNTTGALYISPKSNENGIQLVPDGTVRLYYDSNARAETIADGFKVKYSDDTGATTLKLENNSTHNSQNPKVKIAVDLATGKNGGSIEFIRGNNYQSSAAADSEIVISPTKNDSNTEIVRITQDWFRLHSNCSGIQFNSDTAQANALNDYEEGTWSPTFQYWDGSSYQDVTFDDAPNYTYGHYVKVGNLVHVWYYSGQFSTDSGMNTQPARISGLPFIFKNASPYYGGVFKFIHTNCFKDSNNNLFDCHGGYAQYNSNAFYPSIGNSSGQARWGSESGRYLMMGGTYQSNT